MNAQVYAVSDEKTEIKDHLKGQGLDGKITPNFPLRLTKQDGIKMHG
jgi:predicted GNAT family acetyltransferase